MSFLENQCYFCGEVESLIEMNTNSLIIESVYIDFAQLILELMQIKMEDESTSSNMICIPCKDQLSQFYVMKQQASKHLKSSDIRKIQIVETVVSFLDQTFSDCIVTKHTNLLAIHPDSNNSLFAEQMHDCNSLLESEAPQLIVDEVDDVIEFNVIDMKDDLLDYKNDQEIEAEVHPIEDIIKGEECRTEPSVVFEKPEPVKLPQKRAKKYQKSNLDTTQKEWMKKEIKKSAIYLDTPFGNKIQWCCSKCSFKCFSSENSFRIHLKSHLEKSEGQLPEDMFEEDKKQVTAEDQSIIEQKLWINQQLLSQKENIDSSEGPKTMWTCSQCDFVTQKRGRFRMHLQKQHTTILMRGPSKHSCFDCNMRFDGENHLIVHKNCHRIFDVIAPYAKFPACEPCKMFFVTNDDLLVHLERHRETPETIDEPITAIGVVHRNGESFMNEDDDRPEVFDENSPACGHCLQRFASENECKNHLMLFHATFFTCPFDSRVFQGIPTLSFGNHLRQCHPDVFPNLEIACKLCKMQFETVYDKLAHMKKCKAKMLQCDHCDRSFFKKTDLLHHLKVVTGLMVFACQHCGKRCKDQGDLKTHIRSHSNIRPYQCPHCEKAYKTSSARASHVESHMEQTHVCSICNVKFRRRILYQRHMKLLHDEAYRLKCFTENTCKVCNKSYLRRTHFKNHMKTHNVE